MHIHAVLFVTSIHNQAEETVSEGMMKTFESNIRPMESDLFDDQGFHPDYHNGYEVVKVTLNLS